MKLLWLCNAVPGVITSHITGKPAGGVNWVDHVLSGLRQQGHELRILCRGNEATGVLDETCSYRCFGQEPAHAYQEDLEKLFRVELRSFKPDVIHSWGVEYSHCLAMANAAEAEGLLDRMVASIQGLCAVLAEHYGDGLPKSVVRGYTLRDLLRRDNIAAQREKFARRGVWEEQAVRKLRHVIGRTWWDKAHTAAWNPEIRYHFCNETLRECFYEGLWQYDACQKHRIFASSCAYPIKGFHHLLKAFEKVLQVYPDATLAVTGNSFFVGNLRDRLRQGSYSRYLASLSHAAGMEDRILFLGGLDAERMKAAFLEANVFVLPSVMENSPNSLGEAMLLGVPCVASDVGGVRDLMNDPQEGRICAAGDENALAEQILAIFAMEDAAEKLGGNARKHAAMTHDPEKNLRDLIAIYEEVLK